jgi:large subunit ribosomal protein L23
MSLPEEIIIRPLLTEKGTWLTEQQNKYVFEVARLANKVEIRRAVERLWPVKVVSVSTQTVRGKIVRRGRFVGKRNNWKKAIVTLAEGDSIDLFEGV